MLKTQTPQVSDKEKVQVATQAPVKGVKPALSQNVKPQKVNDEEEVMEVFEEGGGIKKGSFLSNLLIRAAILAFINLIGVAGIIYFNRKIPEKALEVKSFRSEQLGISAQNSEIIKRDIEESKELADKLFSLFPDDEGLVNFANELDRIKAEGKIVGFSFATEEAVKDKTGSIGIPVLIEIKGTWAEIDTDLQKIQKLPYLLRPIQVSAAPAPEEGLIDLKFGGFLYVGKDFGKN